MGHVLSMETLNSQTHMPLPTVRVAERIYCDTRCPELCQGTRTELVAVVSDWTITKQIYLSLVGDGSGLT